MRAIVHIGFPKTGTTSIQRYCSANYDVLRQSGVLFAKTGRILWRKDRARHIGLRIACSGPDVAPTGLMKSYGLANPRKRQRYSRTFFRQLDREIQKNSTCETILFSAEELSSCRDVHVIQKLHNEMTARFDSVTAFCMIREPFDRLSSGFSQYVKTGGAEPWTTYRDRRLASRLYLDRIRLWQQVFGQSNVITRIMQGNALDQFAEILGQPIDTTTQARQNPALSAQGVELLRALNAEYERIGKKRPGSVRTLFVEHMTGSGWKAPSEDCDLIYDAFADEMASLKVECDLPSSDLSFLEQNWQAKQVKTRLASKKQTTSEDLANMTAMLTKLF